MTAQPSRIEISLPDWVSDYAGDGHVIIPDIDQRMDYVIEASRRNIDNETGGPFAAAVFERDGGRLVSLGTNLVLSAGLSILHAEIIALTLAQLKTGSYDLGAPHLPRHELVSSAEPCAMCLGAVTWSGVVRLVTGAADADARGIGFDEGAKPGDWCGALEARGIEAVTGLRREQAAGVLSEYLRRGGHIYNSREN